MKKVVFSIILLSFQFGFSQNHLGVFPTIDHSGELSSRWEYSLYYFGAINLKNSTVNSVAEKPNFFAFYSEQALTFKAKPKLSFTASYVYERQHPFASNYRNENRFYIQSTYKHAVKRVALKHRIRFDGRFIQNRTTGETPFTSRIRYLIGVKFPLQKDNDKFYFSAYNEFFFSTIKNPTTIYSENWAAANVGYNYSKNGAFELGPLYIFWVNSKNFQVTNFAYLQLGWVTHFNFKKDKTTE